MTTPTPFPRTLLERAFSPDTAANHYTERVLKRPLTIRPTSPAPSSRALRRRALNDRKAQQSKRNKNNPRPLSAAQKRRLCLTELPTEQQKYSIYEPLHDLWLGYLRDVLGLSGNGGEVKHVHLTPGICGQLLATADMHGAVFRVVKSRCVSRVGVEGIVVRDTRFTFEVVTRGNVVKSIPKEHTVFRFEIPQIAREGEEKPPFVFEIVGEHFQTRAADRANKKFRMHYHPVI